MLFNIDVNISKLKRHNLIAIFFSLTILLTAAMPLQSSLNIEEYEELVFKYVPVLRFTSGEKFYPTSVDYIIGSSILKQRNPDGTSTLIDPAPNPDTLGTYTSSNLFLENKLGTFESIVSDYTNKVDSIGYYTYVNIVKCPSGIVIQYWLFYVFNNGPLNEHQGDIEVIQVFLDSSGNPKIVLASQHNAGQNAAWGDVEKLGTHPVIYVAQGSHANYFRPYQGRILIENDIVGNDGKTINPDQLNIVLLNGQSWLDYRGRWGYWGTDEEIALGRAGPLGPKYNQNGVRWYQPETYLASTFHVDGNYFILAWLAANFMTLFSVYIAARSLWKIWSIIRLKKRRGLLIGKFIKGRGGIGLIIGAFSIILSIIAFFTPWYTISASSETGLLSQEGGVTLMNIDGVNGLTLNLFLEPESSDSPSGYVNLFSLKTPFAIILAAGVILLTLDIIGVKSGKGFSKKLIISALGTLLPILLIIIFISQIQLFVPFAASLLPNRNVPKEVEEIIRGISVSPISGAIRANIPIIGLTIVSWGLGLGAYLLIASAMLKILAGLIACTVPNLSEH